MRRRELLFGLSGAVVALPGPVAMAADTPARVGFVSGGDERGAADFIAALRDGFAREGFREPRCSALIVCTPTTRSSAFPA